MAHYKQVKRGALSSESAVPFLVRSRESGQRDHHVEDKTGYVVSLSYALS